MDRELTFTEHLKELRRRLIICLVSLGLGVVFSLPFSSYALRLLKLPARTLIEKLFFFSPQEALLVHLRIAFLLGLFFSLPVIFYQVWNFILPALGDKLRRHANFFILFCIAAFIAGCFFAYFILIPPALKFLLNFGRDELEPVISAQKYIAFVISLILGCGLVFQMPVFSLILTKLKVINARILRKKYKYALVVILIVAAIITPTPDAFNMLILALPMLFLYEFSIWVSYFAQPRL